jgi:hypothetical protein
VLQFFPGKLSFFAFFAAFNLRMIKANPYDVIRIDSYSVIRIDSYSVIRIDSYDVIRIDSYDVIRIDSYSVIHIDSYDVIKSYPKHHFLMLGVSLHICKILKKFRDRVIYNGVV